VRTSRIITAILIASIVVLAACTPAATGPVTVNGNGATIQWSSVEIPLEVTYAPGMYRIQVLVGDPTPTDNDRCELIQVWVDGYSAGHEPNRSVDVPDTDGAFGLQTLYHSVLVPTSTNFDSVHIRSATGYPELCDSNYNVPGDNLLEIVTVTVTPI